MRDPPSLRAHDVWLNVVLRSDGVCDADGTVLMTDAIAAGSTREGLRFPDAPVAIS